MPNGEGPAGLTVEIDDPYTGRCLEGVEREGARRAVLAMRWLNGEL